MLVWCNCQCVLCIFLEVWQWTHTRAVLVCAVVLLPLCSIKDLKPIMDMNSWGVLSVVYCLVFIIVQTLEIGPIAAKPYARPYFEVTFFHLAGLMMSSLLVHHGVLPICQVNSLYNGDKGNNNTFYSIFIFYLVVSFFPLGFPWQCCAGTWTLLSNILLP